MGFQQSYWNGRYNDEGTIWGKDACLAAKLSEEIFRKHNVSMVLVPGCGYGRNSGYLASKGFSVNAFDISDRAIEIAKSASEYNCSEISYKQGDILEEDFCEEFNGILSINLLHLFNEVDREKVISKYTKALEKNGVLVLTSMSINDPDYGKGEMIDKYTFESKKGRPIHYFDLAGMKELIGKYLNVLSVEEIKEYENHGGKEHYHNMILVVAVKN